MKIIHIKLWYNNDKNIINKGLSCVKKSMVNLSMVIIRFFYQCLCNDCFRKIPGHLKNLCNWLNHKLDNKRYANRPAIIALLFFCTFVRVHAQLIPSM
ncbi:MAG TPA: hypothetical protein PLK07_08680, partial [Rectinema sp.]|nr:hypothetical protein [Rectinema sp.]